MARSARLAAAVLLLCGCSGLRGARVDDDAGDASGGFLGTLIGGAITSGVEAAVGDNAGPIFTGETRGEYRDRRQTERLGLDGFRRRYRREPDLYTQPDPLPW